MTRVMLVKLVKLVIIGTGSKFTPLPSAHAHCAIGQSCTGRILFVHELCLYVL